MSEIEEQLDHSIEEIETIMEEEAVDSHGVHEKWVTQVALSSTIMAVLAAIMALFATYASDEAFVEQSQSGTQLAYYETKRVNHNVLKNKHDILMALGKQLDEAEVALLNKYHREIEDLKKEFERAEDETSHLFETHDLFAIAVTLLQVAIAVGGISVIIRHRKVWTFSLIFATVGLFFGVWGLTVW